MQPAPVVEDLDVAEDRRVGSLLRTASREVRFLRVLPPQTPDAEVRRVRRELQVMADDKTVGESSVDVVRSIDPATVVTERADESDLLILGAQRLGRNDKVLGTFTRVIAGRTSCPMVVVSRRG